MTHQIIKKLNIFYIKNIDLAVASLGYGTKLNAPFLGSYPDDIPRVCHCFKMSKLLNIFQRWRKVSVEFFNTENIDKLPTKISLTQTRQI